ncbi:MAG: hypothetical protein IKT52_09670 [Oscillospiraceae bacterium]|nr:hypothetical protein [Oscillospiraceae bacterium]
MLKSNYRITLVGGSFIDGEEVFEVEADRVISKLKKLNHTDLLTIEHDSGVQMHIPCWQILSVETTPVIEVG